MNQKNQNIDEYFKDKLSDYETEPPADVWNAIERKLNSRRNYKAIIYRIAAIMAIPVTIAAWHFWGGNAPNRNIIKNQTSLSDNTIVPSSKIIENKPKQSIYYPIKPKNANTTSTNYKVTTPKEIPVVKSKQNINIPEINKNESYNATQPETIEKVANTAMMMHNSLTFKEKQHSDTINIPSIKGHLAFVFQKQREEGKFDLPKLYYANQATDNLVDYNSLYSDNENIKSHKGKWLLGGSAGPLYSYRTTTNNETSSNINNVSNPKESGLISYAGGLNIQYAAAKRLSIQSGVYYSRIGEKVEDIPIASSTQIDKYGYSNHKYIVLVKTNSIGVLQMGDNKNVELPASAGKPDASNIGGTSPTEIVDHTNIYQNLEYIEFPVIIRYKFVERKAGISLLGGMSSHVLVNTNTYLSGSNILTENTRTTDIKPVNYSAVLGIGIEYPLTSSLRLTFEPTFKYYINSINTTEGNNTHPYYIGIMTGIYFNL
jgi:hypothetical protein